MEEKYGEYVIRYSETRNEWEISMGKEFVGKRSSLSEAKKFIDKLNKEDNRLKKRIPVFKLGSGWEEKKKGEISSVVKDEKIVWVVWENKRRTKEIAPSYRDNETKITDLFLDNEKNREKLGRYEELDTKIEELTEERENIYKEMECFDFGKEV